MQVNMSRPTVVNIQNIISNRVKTSDIQKRTPTLQDTFEQSIEYNTEVQSYFIEKTASVLSGNRILVSGESLTSTVNFEIFINGIFHTDYLFIEQYGNVTVQVRNLLYILTDLDSILVRGHFEK